MKAMAPAILYALFVWWFATGLVLMLVLRQRRMWPSLVAIAILFPASLVVVAITASQTSALAAYLAFTATIVLWGTQEVAFLTGVLTGPRPLPCPSGAQGFDRFCYAVCAILYHEIALFVSGAAVVVVSAGQANQVATMTFLVLWIMRMSAKLNLFFGVPVLNDEMLPAKIGFIRSYFRRAPANAFFPVAMLLSALFTLQLIDVAGQTSADAATRIGAVLVAVLLGLAIVEHAFMLVPLPIDRLWKWSTRGARTRVVPAPRCQTAGAELDRVVATRP